MLKNFVGVEKSCNFAFENLEKSCKLVSENLEKSCNCRLKILEKSCRDMLRRKIIKELEKWREETSNKALLIKGARQIGKTTIVRHFAKLL